MMVENSEKIYSDSFGLWLSGLFSAISGNNPGISFQDQKNAFFSLLRLWLSDGKIFFCDPEDPLVGPWKADVDEIISYLKDRWPDSADTEDDADLNLYFYEVPAILWVDESGQLHGS